MRRKRMLTGLVLVSFFVFAFLSLWVKLQRPENEALNKYKTITLNTSTTCDLPLIALIEYLRDLSLCATHEITGNDDLAVSVTVYATSDWKLKKRAVLTFNGLTIYEAFRKVATEFNLIMKYENGRFVFKDPEYSDTTGNDLFKDGKEP
jgi:hypothetical protein